MLTQRRAKPVRHKRGVGAQLVADWAATDLPQPAAVDASVLSEVYQRLQALGNVRGRRRSSQAFLA